MASASKLEKVNRMLRSVLLSEKGGVAINRLPAEYRSLIGDPLPFMEFGYQSLEAFLKSIPTVVSLQRGPDGSMLCLGVADDSTKHIASLVSRQKGKKTKRGSRYKPGRSYARPTYVTRPKPVYSHTSNPSYRPRPVRPKFQTSRPTPQSYTPAPSHGKPPKQQFAKPAQQAANPVKIGGAKPSIPTQQIRLQSTYAKPVNALVNSSDSLKSSATTSRASSTGSTAASTTQQPTPGPWSGKLGSKRNQQPVVSSSVDDKRSADPNSQSTKAVYENIYISVENANFQQVKSTSKSKGKAKLVKSNVKPEWSANFEVPPRFKKLTSPTGQGYRDDDEDTIDATSEFFTDAAPSTVSPMQPSPQTHPVAPAVDSTTCEWIQMTLREKPNGVWASALCTMHQKEFGIALETNIIEQMSRLNLIQKESIYNNDILYPKLVVNVKDTPTSTPTERSVSFGAGDAQQEVAEKTGNQTSNAGTHSHPDVKPRTAPMISEHGHSIHPRGPQDPSPANSSMVDILKSVCHRQNLSLDYKTDYVTLLNKLYVSVRCTAGLEVGVAYGQTEIAAKQAASANILHQWNVTPGELSQTVGGCEELYLRVEHGAGFCSCTPGERSNDRKVPACMSTLSRRLAWKPSDDWGKLQNGRLAPRTNEARGNSTLTQAEKLEVNAAGFGHDLKVTSGEESQNGATLMKLPLSQVGGDRICVLNSGTLLYPQETTAEMQNKDGDTISSDTISSSQIADVKSKPAGVKTTDARSLLTQDEILKMRAKRFGLSVDHYICPKEYKPATSSDITAVKKASRSSKDEVAVSSRRACDQDIRQVLRETFGKTAIYETVKQTGTEADLLVSVCFIAGSVVGVGKGLTKSEARKAALKELLTKQSELKKKVESKNHRKPKQQMTSVLVQDPAATERTQTYEEMSDQECQQDPNSIKQTHTSGEDCEEGNFNTVKLQTFKEQGQVKEQDPESIKRTLTDEDESHRGLEKQEQEIHQVVFEELIEKESREKEENTEKQADPSTDDAHHKCKDAPTGSLKKPQTHFQNQEQSGKKKHSEKHVGDTLQEGTHSATFPGETEEAKRPICVRDCTRWQLITDPQSDSPRNGNSELTSQFASSKSAFTAGLSNSNQPRVSPTAQLPSNTLPSNPSPSNQLPSNQLPRNSSPHDSLRSNSPSVNQIAENPSDAQLPRNTSPSVIPDEETPCEPNEGWVLSTLEAPGVPSLQLPDEDEWDVYVAFITSVSDFFAILIGDDYSEQLIVLEEEMRTFYQCCTWTITEPPEEGDCYAAEFNREWLRVEVKSVEGDKVQCFLLDHGDVETADVNSLRPLSESFLQLPFQVIHCKLSGCEQVAEDDSTALQMFCQLALGKSLLSEVISRDGDRVEMELFDNSDISILEQCLAAGI